MPMKFKCPHCSAELTRIYVKVGEDCTCDACNKTFSIPQYEVVYDEARHSDSVASKGSGSILFLWFIGFLNMVGATIAALYLWIEGGQVVLGIGLVIEGIIVLAFVLVVTSTAEHVIEIRKKVSKL